MLELDFENDLLAAHNRLNEEWGFADHEIKHIMKYKPAFLLYQEDYDKKKSGLIAVNKYLVEKRKFDYQEVKTLIVKYPAILSKTEDQLHKQFADLRVHAIGKKEAMKYFMQCPRLLSVNIEEQIKEHSFLFDLYHKMPVEDLMKIFKEFPYVLCVSPLKIR